MSNELQKKVKLQTGTNLGALRARAVAEVKKINPLTVPNRYVISFDTSGSMSTKDINDAKAGVNAFLDSCSPLDTSVSIVTLSCTNINEETDFKQTDFLCDYDAIRAFVHTLTNDGGTPLYRQLYEVLQKETATRIVVFSDGEPTDPITNLFDNVKTEEECFKCPYVPIDTIHIGGNHTNNALKHISHMSGGSYYTFENAAMLRKQLKYLSPRFQLQLTNPEVRARLERGETL